MKISPEKADGLQARFLQDELIFGQNHSNARAMQGSVVPKVIVWNMNAIKGIEEN